MSQKNKNQGWLPAGSCNGKHTERNETSVKLNIMEKRPMKSVAYAVRSMVLELYKPHSSYYRPSGEKREEYC